MRSNATRVGVYNSEYRGFNRGFGRGSPKNFQSPQPRPSLQPPRKSDLFIEAGRLAVEYLVSHGILASNVLPGKHQNGGLRIKSGESEDHLSLRDREIPSSPLEGRSLAVARPGAATPDEVSGSRKSPDDQDPSLFRNDSKERRRLGASRSYSSEWIQDNGKEGSWSNKATAAPVMHADNDKFHKETPKDAEDVRNSPPAESASKDGKQSELHNEIEKNHPHVDSDSKATSSLQNKDEGELPQPFHGVNNGLEETKDGTGNHDMGQETGRDKLDIKHCEEKNNTPSKHGMDLLKLCPSAKVPTKVRSSLTNKSPKRDPLVINEEKNSSDTHRDSLDSNKADTLNGSTEIPYSSEIPNSSCLGMALSDNSFVESQSVADKMLSYEQKPSGLAELGSCDSIANDRGEKRAFEGDDEGEGTKKVKQWLSVAPGDDYSQLSDLGDKQSKSLAKNAGPLNIFNKSSNEHSFANVSLPANGGVESAIEQVVKKPVFPSSFKICDLNLMEASDMHENHDPPVLLFPSVSAPNKDAAVDIELSMHKNCSLTNEFNDCAPARKDIEIIDLESDSLPEDKNMNTSTRNMEGGIIGMESFPNNSQNFNANPDGQDGYGFMISELLGNDVPNCSSVQPDINSLHNEMGLHHEQGIFSEDDPIYMSLGEIPLSLLRVWEQPTQERNPYEL